MRPSSDISAEALPYAAGGLVHFDDVRLFNLDGRIGRFQDLDIDGASAGRCGCGERAGIDQSILGLDAEQLLALEMVHLDPFHGGSTEDVVDADVEWVSRAGS